jgi:hypothetical protein
MQRICERTSTVNPERGVYLSLGACVLALLIAVWAVWEARSAVNRADSAAARLDPIETARSDEAGRIAALHSEVEELARRLDELEQAAAQPRPANDLQADPPSQLQPEQPEPAQPAPAE